MPDIQARWRSGMPSAGWPWHISPRGTSCFGSGLTPRRRSSRRVRRMMGRECTLTRRSRHSWRWLRVGAHRGRMWRWTPYTRWDCFREAGEETSNSKAMINGQFRELELQGINELDSVAREMLILIETVIASIFAVDADGRINGWNAKVAELTGLPMEEAMGKSLVKDLVFEEFADVVNKLLYRALRGEEDKNVELKMKTFGSQHRMNVIFLMVNACSKRDYTNNIIGVYFVGQDVTGQKLVMDKFIHIQGDYKAIVHSPNPLIPPIFASDANTCCSEWNTAMKKLTGWSRGEMIGLNHYFHK